MDDARWTELVGRARTARSTLVITGAGVSLASGIPTFRGTDPDAVWSRDVLELGTNAYFERDPVGSWRFYLGRFDPLLPERRFGSDDSSVGVRHAEPNPAHRALVEWERLKVAAGAEFLLVTQNVDGLHARAGSERLVEVHGTAERVRCSRVGCVNGAPRGTLPRDAFDLDPLRAEPSLAHIPRCPACDSLLRQHVLWFDETYDGHESYQILRVVRAARAADLVVFVGTSFSVGVTEMILGSALGRRVPTYSIDPGGATPQRGVVAIAAAAEVALPRLVTELTTRGTREAG